MKRRTASGLLDFLGHNAIALIALFVALEGPPTLPPHFRRAVSAPRS